MAMLCKSRVVLAVFILVPLFHSLLVSCSLLDIVEEENRNPQSEAARGKLDSLAVARQRFRQFLRHQGTDHSRTVLQSPIGQQKSILLDCWPKEAVNVGPPDKRVRSPTGTNQPDLLTPIRSQEERRADQRLINDSSRQEARRYTTSLRARFMMTFSNHLSVGFRMPNRLRAPISATFIFSDNLNFIRNPIQFTCDSEQSRESYGQVVPIATNDPLVQPKIYVAGVTNCIKKAVEAGDSYMYLHLTMPCSGEPELCQPDDSPVILISQ